jgi:hypothetical protein
MILSNEFSDEPKTEVLEEPLLKIVQRIKKTTN